LAEERPTDDLEDPLPGDDVPSPDALPAAADPPQPSDGAPAAAHDPAPESEAARAYHQRARLAEDRLAEVLAAYRTIKSENEGFRERISRNLQRRFTQRHETLLLKFIDILDNLDRALEAAQRSYAGEPLLEGMILVRTQLLQRLKEEGLERIPVLGMAFDPEVSESVATQPVGDPDHHNFVMKELMRGYRVNGRVVRPSRVVIGAYQEGAPAAPSGPVIDNAAPAVPLDDRSLEEIVAQAEAQLENAVLDPAGGDDIAPEELALEDEEKDEDEDGR
jgi:molecular chaperone GrpE